MKHIETTQLSSRADAVELRAAIMAAQPGQAFEFDIGDGRHAILILSALLPSDGWLSGLAPLQPGRSNTCGASGISKLESKRLSREAQFVEITRRVPSKARSVHAAALQITSDFNQAHYLGKLYRKRFCIPAAAFLPKTDNIFKDLTPATCENTPIEFQKLKGERMDKALAPDKLNRVIPRHWLIDLDAELLADATREEILSPLFWQEAAGKVGFGDVVTLARANGPALDILIGVPHEGGGLYVRDLAETGHIVPPAAHEAAA